MGRERERVPSELPQKENGDKDHFIHKWENSREEGLQHIARKSCKWSFEVDVHTEEIEKNVCNIYFV